MLIKVAGVRKSRFKKSAWAYEAKDHQRVIRFYGVASSKVESTNGVVQEALMEAVITVRNYGFQRTLILTNSKKLVQLISKSKKPAWQERSLIADLEFLYQNGLLCKLLVIHKVVLDFVYFAANLANPNANSPKFGRSNYFVTLINSVSSFCGKKKKKNNYDVILTTNLVHLWYTFIRNGIYPVTSWYN